VGTHLHVTYAVSRQPERFLISCAVALLGAACDANVVIGAKWSLSEAGAGSQMGGGGALNSAGAPDGVLAGAAGDDSGFGGASARDREWCAVAPWLDAPVVFSGEDGSVIPAGSYWLTYVSGAQIHDVDIGYEVTGHYYGKNALEAGHHLFSGDRPETSVTHVWLADAGLATGATLAAVEQANRGHHWPLELPAGELRITLYDDDYHDNSGPGSKLCIVPAP
jgi:hypothetical protein